MKQFSIGTKVRINTNYLKQYLESEAILSKEYYSIGTIKNIYYVEDIDFYEVLWEDNNKIEAGYNKELLTEICDPNFMLKELC